jgi:hypothetical protein
MSTRQGIYICHMNYYVKNINLFYMKFIKKKFPLYGPSIFMHAPPTESCFTSIYHVSMNFLLKGKEEKQARGDEEISSWVFIC